MSIAGALKLGIIGGIGSVAISYFTNILPCGLVSPGARTICEFKAATQSLGSWQLGFVVGSAIGFFRPNNMKLLTAVIKPQYLALFSAGCLACAIASQTGKSSANGSQLAVTKKPQVDAFLDTIGWAETGTVGVEGYKALVFNGHFNDFSRHPLTKQCAAIGNKQTCSTAAGRYQMLDKNWYELKQKLNLPDFSPASQDKMALALIQEKGALADVEAGRFKEAACKVGGTWASFPCNSYGQHPHSTEELFQVYEKQLAIRNAGI